jgi:hypothetical protein
MAEFSGGSDTGALAPQTGPAGLAGPSEAANVGDILLRILDQGIVIAGDIQINLLDIELLTIKLRLLIASVDTARDMGINWWESDPTLKAAEPDSKDDHSALVERIAQLERRLEAGPPPAEGNDG